MTELACTPGQTVGPFFSLGLPYPGDNDLVGAAHPDAVRLHGNVCDGTGGAIPDALIELWQPDTAGRISRQPGSLRRDGERFTGWGRCATDGTGHYEFHTVTPGSVPAGRPAFFAVTVFARGLLDRLFTRAFLPETDLQTDPLLMNLNPERRAGLLCVDESGPGQRQYRFDIHLQGPKETVFLTYRAGRS
jgi:protocatechuate 3,4-dioxygenase alpha subunit